MDNKDRAHIEQLRNNLKESNISLCYEAARCIGDLNTLVKSLELKLHKEEQLNFEKSGISTSFFEIALNMISRINGCNFISIEYDTVLNDHFIVKCEATIENKALNFSRMFSKEELKRFGGNFPRVFIQRANEGFDKVVADAKVTTKLEEITNDNPPKESEDVN